MNTMEEFRDTVRRLREQPALQQACRSAAAGTRLYPSGFVCPRDPGGDVPVTVEVTGESTIGAALRLYAPGRVISMMNFANPFVPGGGVLNGAMAQEECLCRQSGLYPCLLSESAAAYYAAHKEEQAAVTIRGFYPSSDRVIASPSVPIIKADRMENGRMLLSPLEGDYPCVHVLTCAAPCFAWPAALGLFGAEVLSALLLLRIQNILEVAMDLGTEVLVAGAFGCGVFGNPPTLVAQVFSELLARPRYAKAFAQVTFAVLDTSREKKNYQAFRSVLMPERT